MTDRVIALAALLGCLRSLGACWVGRAEWAGEKQILEGTDDPVQERTLWPRNTKSQAAHAFLVSRGCWWRGQGLLTSR